MPKNKVLYNNVLDIYRKLNFRFAETDFVGGKQLISSAIKGGLFWLALHMLSVSAAEQTMSTDSVRKAVSRTFEQEVSRQAGINNWQDYKLEYEVIVPHSANYLPLCPEPLAISERDHQTIPVGNLKRAVSCDSLAVSWRINITIKSALKLTVVVANTAIRRGEEITQKQLRTEKRTLTRPQDFFSDVTQAIGKQAIRRIRNGHIINPNSLSAPTIVRKGNQVIVIASKQGFTATTTGIALDDGVLGQQIDIQNSSSGNTIKAVVTGLNQVQTQF